MAWLSSWLRELILVVLLAAFVDLLLPNNALQRYVKTVLSLFILLTLLSPLLSLFHKQWDMGKLLASVEQTVMTGSAGAKQVPSVQAIMQQAKKWQAEDQAQAQQLLETQMAAELQQYVPDSAGVEVKQVSVTIEEDNNGSPQLRHVQVILHPIDAQQTKQDEQRKTKAKEPVQPIQPVHISVQIGDRSNQHVQEPQLTAEEEQVKKQFQQTVLQQWRLKQQQLTVLYASELRDAR